MAFGHSLRTQGTDKRKAVGLDGVEVSTPDARRAMQLQVWHWSWRLGMGREPLTLLRVSKGTNVPFLEGRGVDQVSSRPPPTCDHISIPVPRGSPYCRAPILHSLFGSISLLNRDHIIP